MGEPEGMFRNMESLETLIATKPIQPTIINPNSNFVMITYWWGRGRENNNTARPCVMFFEKLVENLHKKYTNFLASPTAINRTISDASKNAVLEESLDKYYLDRTLAYKSMIYEYLGMQPSEENKDERARVTVEERKQVPSQQQEFIIRADYTQTPNNYTFRTNDEVKNLIAMIMRESINISKENIFNLYRNEQEIKKLKRTYKQMLEVSRTQNVPITSAAKKSYLTKINELSSAKQRIRADIIKQCEEKRNFESSNMQIYNGKSIYEILRDELRFLKPITLDEMIKKWEKECIRYNCNYMAVEYPEFAVRGNYQYAINAKPFFIRKAREATGSRSVVYIDGDMFVRRYPKIFDIPDVDYMARGWSMDPRSSYNFQNSIEYDPYTFETSGGIMMFSQSDEASRLCDLWIKETKKPSQRGKADDRIISLIFNSYSLLLPMKVIMLPIEYLWLSLDFDERMLEFVYNYDIDRMKRTIIIEHPECLTSEDTATGAGASSDRTPKYYSFLSNNIDNVSELFHEYINFSSKELTNEVYGEYLKYMRNDAFYLYDENDPNKNLIDKDFIARGRPVEDNAKPLYIIEYDKMYGDILYPPSVDEEERLTYNKVAEYNRDRIQDLNIPLSNGIIARDNNFGLVETNNMVEISDLSKLMKQDDPTKLDSVKIIRIIIKLLEMGKNVLYNPTSLQGYNRLFYNALMAKLQNEYRNMELVFVPEFTPTNLQVNPESNNFFYKPMIQLNQIVYFKPSEILIKYLYMFLSLNDLSAFIKGGSYQFVSRVRIGYLTTKMTRPMTTTTGTVTTTILGGKKQKRQNKKKLCGGNDENNEFYVEQETLSTDLDTIIDLYNEGLNYKHTNSVGPTTGGLRRLPNKKYKKTKKVRFSFRTHKIKHKVPRKTSSKNVKKTRRHKNKKM